MIPRDYITEWRLHAPWVLDSQIEQDLVISRALVSIFSHPLLCKSLAFRGGTALYKLYIKPPARYSEDIDLVQINAEPAGPMMDALHETLDFWLGPPKWKQSAARVTFVYHFVSEDMPPLDLRLKKAEEDTAVLTSSCPASFSGGLCNKYSTVTARQFYPASRLGISANARIVFRK